MPPSLILRGSRRLGSRRFLSRNERVPSAAFSGCPPPQGSRSPQPPFTPSVDVTGASDRCGLSSTPSVRARRRNGL